MNSMYKLRSFVICLCKFADIGQIGTKLGKMCWTVILWCKFELRISFHSIIIGGAEIELGTRFSVLADESPVEMYPMSLMGENMDWL